MQMWVALTVPVHYADVGRKSLGKGVSEEESSEHGRHTGGRQHIDHQGRQAVSTGEEDGEDYLVELHMCYIINNQLTCR